MRTLPIKGYEGLYEITDTGVVITERRITKCGVFKEKYANKLSTSDKGYKIVWLNIGDNKKMFYVHRLVGITFIDNPHNYPCINHKNGNKKDNRVENLEWCTHSMNIKHAVEVLGRMVGKRIIKPKKDRRKVIRSSINNNSMDIYQSLSHAIVCSGSRKSSILKCLNTKNKVVGGYKWDFEERINKVSQQIIEPNEPL